MATYGPLIDDGSQTVAAANLSTSASLGGVSSSGQFLAVYISGPRAVNIQTNAGASIYGVLQNTPTSGQAADVGILGITKAVAGAQVTAPTGLKVNTYGRFITATGGDVKVAYAIESAAATGVVFTVVLCSPGGSAATI
jgi:hypothetical protein